MMNNFNVWEIYVNINEWMIERMNGIWAYKFRLEKLENIFWDTPIHNEHSLLHVLFILRFEYKQTLM